jgi:hypothetical protein
MSELRIPPDQSEHLPPYFERNAADVKPEEWPTYEPLFGAPYSRTARKQPRSSARSCRGLTAHP